MRTHSIREVLTQPDPGYKSEAYVALPSLPCRENTTRLHQDSIMM